MKTLTAPRTDEIEIKNEECGADSDLPDAASKTVDTPKQGPAFATTSRTAFMSVRGLA